MKVFISACSQPLGLDQGEKFASWRKSLAGLLGDVTVFEGCIKTPEADEFSPAEKAEFLHRALERADLILDVSGGDTANLLLPLLDPGRVRGSKALFWAYSDNTVLHNAFLSWKAGLSLYYYQPYYAFSGARGVHRLWSEPDFLQRNVNRGLPPILALNSSARAAPGLTGTVVGGNLRCFLKLAGTPFFPDLSGKILLLESWGGDESLVKSLMTQLELMGVWALVKAVILGTFTQLERGAFREREPPQARILRSVTSSKDLPIYGAPWIGHHEDTYPLPLGKSIQLRVL